jgi:hypothetical protein
MCSDNPCTTLTDKGIVAYIMSLEKRETLPRLDGLDLVGASPEDRSKLAAALRNLISSLSQMPRGCSARVSLVSNVVEPLVDNTDPEEAVALLRLFYDKHLLDGVVERMRPPHLVIEN